MSDVIHTLLECDSVSFGPEDIAKLVAGFESALTNLGLKERNDPATTQIAKLIIQLAKDGQRDPKQLAERATRIVRGSSLVAVAAPVRKPWMWTLAFGHHEDRIPTHG